MSESAQLGWRVLKALAQVVGGLLAIFGGGCVVVGTMFGVSEGFAEVLPAVLLLGVPALAVGIFLMRWGKKPAGA